MEYEEFMNMQCEPAQAKIPQTNDEYLQASGNEFQYLMILKAIIKSINQYVSNKEADAASAESKYAADTSGLEARIAEKNYALEKKEKEFTDKEAQYKAQLAGAEKKYKESEAALNDIAAKYNGAEAEKKNIEHKLKRADEVIRSFCKPGMPAEVRISAYQKYLEIRPGDLCIAGIMHNNIAAVLGNELQRYEEAKEHLIKAVSFAQQECIADPSNVSAKVRLEKYEYRLEDCIYNLCTMKSSPGRTFIVAA